MVPGKVPKPCTVTLNVGEECWRGQECGWGKDRRSCYHLNVTCLQQTLAQRSPLGTDNGSFCHPTGMFCSECLLGSPGELCKKAAKRKTNLIRKITSLRCSPQLGAYSPERALSRSGVWSLSAEALELCRILSPFLGEGSY